MAPQIHLEHQEQSQCPLCRRTVQSDLVVMVVVAVVAGGQDSNVMQWVTNVQWVKASEAVCRRLQAPQLHKTLMVHLLKMVITKDMGMVAMARVMARVVPLVLATVIIAMAARATKSTMVEAKVVAVAQEGVARATAVVATMVVLQFLQPLRVLLAPVMARRTRIVVDLAVVVVVVLLLVAMAISAETKVIMVVHQQCQLQLQRQNDVILVDDASAMKQPVQQMRFRFRLFDHCLVLE